MSTTIVAVNQTAGDLGLSQLSAPDAKIPASSEVELTLWNAASEIQDDIQLRGYIDNDDVLLKIDGVLQTKEQSQAFSSPVRIDEDKLIYVGKHGSNSESGLTVEKAVLTFGQAITLVNAQTPSSSNVWGIVCLDAGIYSESVSISSYTHLFAANAVLQGSITLADDSSVEFEMVKCTTGTAVTKSSGTGTAYCTIKKLETTSCNGITNSSTGILNTEVEYYKQTAGIGLQGTVSGGITHADIQDWDLYGTSPTAVKVAAGMLNLRTANIADRGGDGTSIAFDCDGGTTNVLAVYVSTDTLYDVESGATLNLVGANLSGTELNDGTVNLTVAGSGGGTPSDNPVVKARRTTTYTLTTSWVDLTLDTTDIENDTDVVQHNDTNTDRIDLKEAGLYEVYYHARLEEPLTAQSVVLAEARVRANDSTVISGSETQSTVFEDDSIPGSDFEGSISGKFLYSASASDYVTLQLQYTQMGGSGDGIVKEGLTFEVKRLSGQKGDAGPAGADGDITWEGAWSGATAYTANQAVSHEGSSYVCILGHTNQEPPNATYWDVLAGASTAITSDIAEASSSTTRTSSSFALINSMTKTPVAGTYLVWLRANWKLSAAGTVTAAVYAGGTQESDSIVDDEFSSQTDNMITNFATMAKVTVNGSQAIEGRWKVSSGTGTIYERQLMIMKVG